MYIDGDGCPVVDIAIRLSLQAKTNCIIICDTSHVFDRAGAQTIIVPKGNDSVDFTLVNMIQKGDIVITQDYGLAAMCLARGTFPISQDGMLYTHRIMDALLMRRNNTRKMRMAGGRPKGPPKRTSQQDVAFEAALKELLILV